MLKDKRKRVAEWAREAAYQKAIVEYYACFLSKLFSVDDWFVTITFRDRGIEFEKPSSRPEQTLRDGVTHCAADPRIVKWEPSSRYRPEPGPPVRDAALRELDHWLIELGWEAAGNRRQDIFDWLVAGKRRVDLKAFARRLSGKCLVCELEKRPGYWPYLEHLRDVGTRSIGWVIAEEFGRVGGRWHVHILVKGVTKLRRRKWWKRAHRRFGRTRIEPIRE